MLIVDIESYVAKIKSEYLKKDFITCEEFYRFLRDEKICKKEDLELTIKMLRAYSNHDSNLKSVLGKIVDIPRLWKWTEKDLKQIYERTFLCKCNEKLYDGPPTNSFAVVLAAFFDLWGGILKNRFGEKMTKENINEIILLLKKTRQQNLTMQN